MQIVFVGDSLTRGAFASVQANRFADRVCTKFGATEVIAAITTAPGHNTRVIDALNTYPGMLPAGDVTVIELGTNDYSDPTALATFTTQYQQLLAKVNSPVVVCCGIWQAYNGTNSLGVTTAQYNAVIQANAPANCYVELSYLQAQGQYKNIPGTSTYQGAADNFHPNDLGHAAIASLVAQAISQQYTAFHLGSYNAQLDLFEQALDLNDGVSWRIKNDGLHLDMPQKVQARSFTIRVPGETITKEQYKNRHLKVQVWLRGTTVQMLAQIRALEALINTPPLVIRFALPGSRLYTYADVRAVTHTITATTQQILAGAIPTVEIDFECAPFFRGDLTAPALAGGARHYLQNLVPNPGFEAPSGPAVVVFNDTFANANAYTVSGGTATVTANNLYLPNGASATFGSPAWGANPTFGVPSWGAVNQWALRFVWITSLDAYFYLHYTDGNNHLAFHVNGTTMELYHLVGGTKHTLASAGWTPANNTAYWFIATQFPQIQGYAPQVQVTLYNDSAGTRTGQITSVGPVQTFDAVTALSGQMRITATGAQLQIGGAAPNVHTVSLFGPGAWSFAGMSATTGVASGALEQNTLNTYGSGPVLSFGAARIDAPPAGTWDYAWRLSFGGSGVTSTALAVRNPGDTVGLALWVRSTGLSASAGIHLDVTEYDASGNTLRSGGLPALTGNQASWTQMSGTYTTGANCAYLDIQCRAFDLSAPGASANATVWFDNVQAWDVTQTGQAAMPYCELRFPQSPAQLLVSGLQGDMPSPAMVALGCFLSTFNTGTAISFWLGRRAQASQAPHLVAAVTVSSNATRTSTLDTTSYGGFYVLASAGSTNAGYTPFPMQFHTSDMLGSYRLQERWLTAASGYGSVDVRPVLEQFAAGSTAAAYQYYGTFIFPFTAQNTWTPVDIGPLSIPIAPSSALVDPFQTVLMPLGQLADTSNAAARANWLLLLPADGDLVRGVINNPTNFVNFSNVWLYGYGDGLGVQTGGAAGWTYSLNTVANITPEKAAGGPGNQGTGAININPTGRLYLQLDPRQTVNGVVVNELAGYLTDQVGSVLPLHTELLYAPLYLYPR